MANRFGDTAREYIEKGRQRLDRLGRAARRNPRPSVAPPTEAPVAADLTPPIEAIAPAPPRVDLVADHITTVYGQVDFELPRETVEIAERNRRGLRGEIRARREKIRRQNLPLEKVSEANQRLALGLCRGLEKRSGDRSQIDVAVDEGLRQRAARFTREFIDQHWDSLVVRLGLESQLTDEVHRFLERQTRQALPPGGEAPQARERRLIIQTADEFFGNNYDSIVRRLHARGHTDGEEVGNQMREIFTADLDNPNSILVSTIRAEIVRRGAEIQMISSVGPDNRLGNLDSYVLYAEASVVRDANLDLFIDYMGRRIDLSNERKVRDLNVLHSTRLRSLIFAPTYWREYLNDANDVITPQTRTEQRKLFENFYNQRPAERGNVQRQFDDLDALFGQEASDGRRYGTVMTQMFMNHNGLNTADEAAEMPIIEEMTKFDILWQRLATYEIYSRRRDDRASLEWIRQAREQLLEANSSISPADVQEKTIPFSEVIRLWGEIKQRHGLT